MAVETLASQSGLWSKRNGVIQTGQAGQMVCSLLNATLTMVSVLKN